MRILDTLFRPSQDRFAQLFIAELRRRGDPREIVYNKAEFRREYPDEGHSPSMAYLGNMYEEFCQATKSERGGVLERLVHVCMTATDDAIPDDYDEASSNLLPVVRTRFYLEQGHLHSRLRGGHFATHPWTEVGDHLAASLVYDLPDAMVSVSQDLLDKWGVTEWHLNFPNSLQGKLI